MWRIDRVRTYFSIRDFFWGRERPLEEMSDIWRKMDPQMRRMTIIRAILGLLVMLGCGLVLYTFWPKAFRPETLYLAATLMIVAWMIGARTLLPTRTIIVLVAIWGLPLCLSASARHYVAHPPAAAVVVWLAGFAFGLVQGHIYRKSGYAAMSKY